MNNCTFIILGASGDLTKRKLIPAIYRMVAQKKVDNFIVVGAALEETTFTQILNNSREFIEDTIDDAAWQKLVENSYYQKLNFSSLQDFNRLNIFINESEKKNNLSGNRIFYVAAASSFFCMITTHLAKSGCAQKLSPVQKQWHRIVYEKPFGKDAKSAHEINECIKQHFYETQIYRIDHYLTKELVSNIALIRFTNIILEPLWNNRYIDNVQIVLSETVGLEGRGAYYDEYGALRDVVQNHMLELMALIAMEAPEKLTGEFIRDQRAKALQKIRPVDGVLGQYQGYKTEEHVQQNSGTETFAALYLKIDNPRWAGVPFYLKTGKYLDKKETVIHIKFKKVDCLLNKNCPSDSNFLTIRLAPDESFILTMNVKKPGTEEIIPIAMEYCHSCLWLNLPLAHEVLLEEVMRGEQSVSVRFDEIEYAWDVIDAVKKMNLPLTTYQKDSNGPESAQEFAKKHGMRWRS